MIDCEALRERMPDVAHGRMAWTDQELVHFHACRDCAMEWQVVRAGALLRADMPVAAGRIAAVVAIRLADAERPVAVIGRLPWRGGAIGLVAAAASIALILSFPRPARVPPASASDTVAMASVLPELQGLDDQELESVLRSLGPTAADATPGVLPHLGDLTDAELEELLRSQGGQ